MFIVFEGADGSGKSTQLEHARRWLIESGQSVVTCREPGSTTLGEAVRQLALHRTDIAIDPDSEMLLFMVARCQLVREVIQPALRSGHWVLCDRFQMSTAVYQGHAGSVDLESIRRVGEFAAAGLVPDLVFLLDLSPERAATRLRGQPDRFESRGIEYLSAVREGFLTEARQLDQQVHVVDADRPAETIAREIASTIAVRFADRLSRHG